MGMYKSVNKNITLDNSQNTFRKSFSIIHIFKIWYLHTIIAMACSYNKGDGIGRYFLCNDSVDTMTTVLPHNLISCNFRQLVNNLTRLTYTNEIDFPKNSFTK